MKNIFLSVLLLSTLFSQAQMYKYDSATKSYRTAQEYKDTLLNILNEQSTKFVYKKEFCYSCHFETGFHFGLSNSWFGGKKTDFSGIKYLSNGFVGGIYEKIKKGDSYLKVELNYIKLGGKNPKENKTNFSTYHIQLPISYGLTADKLSFELGYYFSYLIYARNIDFFEGGFGWPTNKWDYYKTFTHGLTGGVSYNFIPIEVKITGIYGLVNVRNESYNDPKMVGNKDRGISIMIVVPINEFLK